MRSAGRTRRLYTNGVFHSQYNPARVFGGGLWDLLSLPALMQSDTHKSRVLVLGVGGGAVISALNRLLNNPKIVGVDLDPVHLSVARRWFDSALSEKQLIQDDAKRWLENYSGRPFDLIIEDVFSDDKGEPVRAIPMDRHWFSKLKEHLSPSGMLVINHLNKADANSVCREFSDKFVEAWSLQHPRYQNCVAVHLRHSFTRRVLYKRLEDHPNLTGMDKRVAKNLVLSKFRVR